MLGMFSRVRFNSTWNNGSWITRRIMAKPQRRDKCDESGTESKVITRPHAIYFDPAEKITRDSFKDEVDVNNVIKRFVRTGELPKAREDAQFGEAPNKTLHEAACISAELASMEEEGVDLAPVTDSESESEEKPLPEGNDQGQEGSVDPDPEASPEGAQ
ncbi:internal scaffolding protein [Microviridae sp.]|nr:internal scaffolding protein [Microviridae sp.]